MQYKIDPETRSPNDPLDMYFYELYLSKNPATISHLGPIIYNIFIMEASYYRFVWSVQDRKRIHLKLIRKMNSELCQI